LVRSDNSWTTATQTALALAKTYDNHSIARLDHAPTPWGWTAEFDRDDLKYSDQPSLVQQLVRGKIRHLLRPDLEISASAGYEWNRLTLTEENNAIYGAGISWHPSERTTLTGSWEHRFFGPSYSLQFDHRTPLSAWTFTASRNTTNYPQNFLSLPTGGNVAALVDAAFTTRFPDPLQRQQAVSQFLSQTGLPAQLDSPVNFYTEQITLTRLISGTVALIGARNVVAFTAFESKNRALEPPSTVPLPTLLLSQNNTQRGVNASFSHLLSALTSMNVGATLIRAREDATQDLSVSGKSTQEFFQFLVQTQLGPKTIAFTGARYSIYNAEIFNSYREAAVFVGFDHRF